MLPNFLKPFHIDNKKLVRIGPKLDGGYVIDKKSVLDANIIITCGLNDDWEFEKSLLKINTKCIVQAYDHTIDKKFWVERFKKDIKHFFLLKKIRLRKIIHIFRYLDYLRFFKNHNKHYILKIGTEDISNQEITINKILEAYQSVLLKVDIEGDEYKILDQILDNSKKINTLIIEFHNIHKNLNKIEDFIIKSKELKLIHIHANNFAGSNKDGDPNVIELTFINIKNNDLNLKKTNKSFPINGLDYKNTHRKEDFLLKFND
jgi:hypothetical protein